MSRRRRCDKHPDMLLPLMERCPRCWLAKAEKKIEELEKRLFPKGSVYLGFDYPVDRLFEPVLRALNVPYLSGLNVPHKAERVIVGERKGMSVTWWFEVTPEIAAAMNEVWEKVASHLKSIERSAATHVIYKIQERVKALVSEKLLSQSAISALKKQVLKEIKIKK
jgi:hypothetical protein